VGFKRVLQVSASLSTSRPNVEWCHDVTSKPPSSHERMPTTKEVGPFKMVSVPLSARAITVISCTPHLPGEFTIDWAGEELRGTLSPANVVTLDPAARHKASIPAEAAYFAFSYPLHVPPVVPADLAPETLSFLHGGGFVYFKVPASAPPSPSSDSGLEALELCSISAFETDELGEDLTFDEPQPLAAAPAIREKLTREGRLHAVTLSSLCEIGAKWFVWVKPSENLSVRFDGERSWPHGAFAYFYDDPSFDCIFAVSRHKYRAHVFRRLSSGGVAGHGARPYSQRSGHFTRTNSADGPQSQAAEPQTAWAGP